MTFRKSSIACFIVGCMGFSNLAFAQAEEACGSSVADISIPKSTKSGGAAPALEKIYEADQKDREELMKNGSFNREHWPVVAKHDAAHRLTVLHMLQKQEVRSGDELYFAAFVFQHGQCPEHFQLASTLAQAAIERGSEKAKWLYAASLDRYLLMTNQPQKFGTQFRIGADGKQELAPLDPSTTDEERAKYNVPLLKK